MCRQIFDSYNQGAKMSGNQKKGVLAIENILNY